MLFFTFPNEINFEIDFQNVVHLQSIVSFRITIVKCLGVFRQYHGSPWVVTKELIVYNCNNTKKSG